MTLGLPILSPARMQLRKLAGFAAWETEQAMDTFVMENELGRTLLAGWHVRLEFLRRWGHVSALPDLPASAAEGDPATPVVAGELIQKAAPSGEHGDAQAGIVGAVRPPF